MEEQSRSQRRLQILKGVAAFGSIAGTVVLKRLQERMKDGSSADAGLSTPDQQASLPQPRYTDQHTEGPPLTREASDYLTVCYAFFHTEGALIETAHLVPDAAMKGHFWRFLQTIWSRLDESTRITVLQTPDLWVTLRSNWFSMSPSRQTAIVQYHKQWFEWFGERAGQFSGTAPMLY